jgi:3',5'-nucleoside bisphosphate phosphatase
MKKLISFAVAIFLTASVLQAQRKIVNLPDIQGYKTLKCDFHMHTVFSDGSEWPLNRVSEAYRDGLDAISITDHIEYTPRKDYIPVDHNAAWKICEQPAKEANIILVHGSEITRKMPPGHLNALFITDGNALVKDSLADAVGEAVRQGAFIQWNHPGWKSQEPDGIPKLYSLHKMLLEKKWIHGIEFINGTEYYPLVLDWCKSYNLSVMANSDIHGVISETYPGSEFKNRPMTLVFTKSRDIESLREAVFAGRTIAYSNDMLGGKEEWVEPFFYACISSGKVIFDNARNKYIEITNNSDVPYYLINGPKGAPANINLEAMSVTRVVLPKTFSGRLLYDVKNVMTGSASVLKVEIKY